MVTVSLVHLDFGLCLEFLLAVCLLTLSLSDWLILENGIGN